MWTPAAGLSSVNHDNVSQHNCISSNSDDSRKKCIKHTTGAVHNHVGKHLGVRDIA